MAAKVHNEPSTVFLIVRCDWLVADAIVNTTNRFVMDFSGHLSAGEVAHIHRYRCTIISERIRLCRYSPRGKIASCSEHAGY